MICTTNFDLIPLEHHITPKDKQEDVQQPSEIKYIKVFEKDKGWRSVNIDTLLEFKVDFEINKESDDIEND